MRKKELRTYISLKKEMEIISRRINRLEKKAEEIPIVKTKVQSSMKEFPYIRKNETVEAPEARAYSAIMRNIAILKKREAEAAESLERIDRFIDSIKNAMTRLVLMMVFTEGKRQKDVADELNVTEGWVSRMIKEGIEEGNRREAKK